MPKLHDFFQEYVYDLRALLDKYLDETALINAAEKKWGEHDSRFTFLLDMRRALAPPRLGDVGGTEDGEDVRENVLVRRKLGNTGGTKNGDDV